MNRFGILGFAAIVGLSALGAAGCVAPTDSQPEEELGTAASKLLSSSPSSLNFGNVNKGCFVTLTTLVTNGGPGSDSITSITSSSPRVFAQAGSFPSSLANGASANLSVRFVPPATGSYSGTITIASTSGGIPNPNLVINVSGTGFPPGPC